MKAARLLKTQAGFSLIELMIVVAIIGILASIAVPNFQKFQRRAKQSEGKGYLTSVFTAEAGFRAEWNSYTTDLRCIGFKDPSITNAGSGTDAGDGIQGKGNYIVGFSADHLPTVAGSACLAGGFTARPASNAGTTIPAAVPATNMAASTYMAAAAGDLASGNAAIGQDQWTITHEKVVQNLRSGI